MGLLDDAIKEHLELKRRRGADAAEITRLESEALGPVRRSADGVPDLPDSFEPPQDAPPAPAAAPEAAAPPPVPRLREDEPTVTPPSPSPPGYVPPPPPQRAYEAPPITPPAAPDLPFVTPPPAREAWMSDDPEPELGEQAEAEAATARDFEHEPQSTGLLARLRGRRSKHDRRAEPDPEPDLEPEPPDRAPDTRAYRPHDQLPSSSFDPPPPPSPSYAPPPPLVPHEPDIVPADDEPDVEDLLEETPEFLEETPEHDRLWFEQRPPRDFDFDG
jgi:formin 2